MTDQEIQKALDAIKRVGDEALKSKEASRQFLIDAGITQRRTGIELKRQPAKKTNKKNK